MTNINGNEKIKNAVVNLLTEKLNNDSAKAEEYAKKYLSDNIIDENEFQELSAEFGEDFANEAKSVTETTENGTKKSDVSTWEDAVKYVCEKQELALGELKAGTEPKDCTRTTKTYYGDNGTVVLSRASDHGDYTTVKIEANNGRSYSYNLKSGKESMTITGEIPMVDVNGYDPNSSHTLPMQNYLAWADMIDESRVDVATPTSELKPKSTTIATTKSSSSGTSSTSSSSSTSSGHALKVGDCEWDFEQAEKVYKAIHQWHGCDDWKGLQNLLCNRSNKDLNRIMVAYEIKYGKNMKSDINKQGAAFWNKDKKSAVIAVLTKAESNPNKNGKKEKEEIKAYFNGERW